EITARYLAAAGVGTLRLVGGRPDRNGDGSGFLAAAAQSLSSSNPDVEIRRAAWPMDGTAWLGALEGADLVARAGFDDDSMLRAAVRLGVPAVVARATGDTAEIIAFRHHGP